MSTEFSDNDLQQFAARKIPVVTVRKQLEQFREGFPPAHLQKPATPGDGLEQLNKDQIEGYVKLFNNGLAKGRVSRFVPASGAASRMFKLLLSFNSRYDEILEKAVAAEAAAGSEDHQQFLLFIENLDKFAFYNDLKAVLAEDSEDIEALRREGSYKKILEALLSPAGLNYGNLPKGLIQFHSYDHYSRSAFEEQLVEAAEYARDADGVVRIHFTVGEAHQQEIAAHVEEVAKKYQHSHTKFDVSYSVQHSATDTVAVDLDNQLFRDEAGQVLFRPGGHGALLNNLNDMQGDIVFVKNIDNVVPDHLKTETYLYKKVLGGYLMEMQQRSFYFLKKLDEGDANDNLLRHIRSFAEKHFAAKVPDHILSGPRDAQAEYLKNLLNRPIRVCGMVRNDGEPGGGPFWVADRNGQTALQIVESAQVNAADADQAKIWSQSTHFNPVDLVLGVRDHNDQPFNLEAFVDHNTGFISQKSKNGRDLKALELPGLWNGAMAHWNTIFVEVPMITFNPVKTVLDLLRTEHQPQTESQFSSAIF